VALPFGCAKNPVRIISTTYIDFSAKMAQQLLKKSLAEVSWHAHVHPLPLQRNAILGSAPTSRYPSEWLDKSLYWG
jgi:hypothetical protein